MKKIFALIMTVVLAFSMLAGCKAVNEEEKAAQTAVPSAEEGDELEAEETQAPEETLIRIAGLKGPTSMGMVKLMEDAEQGTAANKYEFTVAASADEVTPKLIKGEYDIAAVPANLASVIFNNTEGKVKLLAVNTLGVIYIVEKGESVQSIADLKGKTIYATGKGSTPEYALNYILGENGLDPEADVKMEWKSEPTEVVQILAKEENAVAMLPQPFVTVAQTQLEGLRAAIDLNNEWKELDNGSLFLTGVLIVRTEFAEQNPEAIKSFLAEYQASTEWVNANPADASVFVEKAGIVKAAVAEKAIPFCNITYIAGEEMKTAMQGYLEVLYNQNPASVGGKLPENEFYYIA